MARQGIFLLLFILGSGVLFPVNAEDTRRQAIVVLDASGSMWGQVDGKAKIVIAREVMSDMLKRWNPDTPLGVIAYGHNRKGDCSDIEMIVPVTAPDKNAIQTAINKLNPKGKTPISAAITTAAEKLKYIEERATVILISDGLETCDADPCKRAAELEKLGVDFTTHVIGFDVNEKEGIAQLSCIAENSGGTFVTAANADELKHALESAAGRIEAEEVAADAPGNVRVVVRLVEGGDPLSTDDVEVVDLQTKQQAGRHVLHSKEHIFKLPPGDYVVRANHGNAGGEANVTVKPAEGATTEVILNAGYLNMSAIWNQGSGKVNTDDFRVYREVPDENGKVKRELVARYVLHADAYTFVLPAGEYVAVMKEGSASAEQKVRVVAGERVEAVLNLNAGTLKVVPVDGDGKPLNIDDYRIYRLVEDENGKHHAELMARYVLHATSRSFILSAGEYEVVVSHRGIEKRNRVEVIAGQKSEATLVLARKRYDSPAGSWKTSEGEMQLESVDGGYRGRYTTDNGQVMFKRQGQELDGYWIEDASSVQCEQEKGGRRYWGRLVIKFNEAFNSFQGWWSYCGSDEHAGAWSGTRE